MKMINKEEGLLNLVLINNMIKLIMKVNKKFHKKKFKI